MTDYEVLQLAHRTCWKYKHGDKGDTYTFDENTMKEFVRLLRLMESPNHLFFDIVRKEYDTWQGNYKEVVKVVLTHCMQRLDPNANL
jgi:hypothetical protein